MIVYGDPSSYETLSELVASLYRGLGESDHFTLDELRGLLVRAGMMEQAVEDDAPSHAAAVRRVTDVVALAFVQSWLKSQGCGPSFAGPSTPADIHEALGRVPEGDSLLRVKVPEGFAFYGLYPDAYAQTARRWCGTTEAPTPLVIGLRSIGTGLSAIVAAVLRSHGLAARRLTIRPTGHPFGREAAFSTEHLGTIREASHVLVVDEGPGLSGSSMASVAEATHRAGIPRDRIVFFPGHGGDPGAQATDEVRAWWASVPRFLTPTEKLRWNGKTLEETLAAATGDVANIRELSGGAWRESVFSDPAEWPGVALPFERRKLLMMRTDGSKVLWKFTGLTEPLSTPGERGVRRGMRSGAPKVDGGEGSHLGFSSSPWIEGQPLRREDATLEILAEIGRHIVAASGSTLSAQESRAAYERLEGMVRVNLSEAGLSPTPTPPQGEGGPSAGDFRLAPYEWRRTPDGGIVKASRISSNLDHTVVGRQPAAWDVAGAIVEWGLDDQSVRPLLENAPPIDPEALRFYCLAYATFRMGLCAMSAAMGPEAEAVRLIRDEAFYQNAILRLV